MTTVHETAAIPEAVLAGPVVGRIRRKRGPGFVCARGVVLAVDARVCAGRDWSDPFLGVDFGDERNRETEVADN